MKKVITILLIISLTTTMLWGQKVGLVLSGGGAKGLYHVGVIKALEQNGVPIDYISGASMGAIVGAMYVAGYSPESMESFFNTDSVQTWLTGKIPEEYRYYFKRFQPTPEMVSIRINPDTTKLAALKIPTNIISPYRIDLAFVNMVQGASTASNNNFDSLMIPFRCVASDVFNKKSIVFNKGCLPFAVRASMTIPLVFKPLKYDSILLYDGGVLNNFPWQPLAEDFKPDIIIGSVCVGNPKNPTEGNIMSQVMAMITNPTDYVLPGDSDIMIRRIFPDLGTLEYDKASSTMAKGYEDAIAMMPLIKQRIARTVSKDDVQVKRDEFNSRIRPLLFESIEVEGLTPKQTDYVNRQLGLHMHSVITAEYFEERYMRILATELFTAEFPKITYNEETGYYRLKLNLKTQPSLRMSLGGNISSTSLNQLYLGLTYQRVGNHAATYGLRGYLGTFYNALYVGGRHDFFTNFPFYIDYSYILEGFDRNTFNSMPYYSNQQWRYTRDNRNIISSSIAVPVLNNAALRFKLSLEDQKSEYYTTFHTSRDDPDKSSFSNLEMALELETHTMDFSLFPHTGKNQLFSLSYKSGIEDYKQGSVFILEQTPLSDRNRNWFEFNYHNTQFFKTRSSWFNIGYTVQVTLSNQPEFANYYFKSMMSPKFSPTFLSRTIFMPEYSSASSVSFGLIPVFNIIGNTFYVKSYAYAFIPKEVVYSHGEWVTSKNIWNSLRARTEFIFGGSIVYQTGIGPASFTVEKYSTGPRNWNFVFNFGYTLFAR